MQANSDKKFWREFNKKYFEKDATSFARAGTPFDLFTEQEVFEMVCWCCGVDRNAVGEHKYLRFYIEGEAQDIKTKALQFLPRLSDHNFLNYHQRVQKILKSQTYYLVLGDFHAGNFECYKRLVDAAQKMSLETGRSKRRVDSQIFIGNHNKTPFGVHIDETSVFHIPVVGRKKMRFWTDAALQNNPTIMNTSSYQDALSDSFSIEAKVGTVIYWPSNLWHIAESDGEFGVTWGFGWWTGENTENIFNQVMSNYSEQLAQKFSRQNFLKSSWVKNRNEVTEKAFGVEYQKVKTQLERRLTVNYLKIKSNYGFWIPAERQVSENKIQGRIQKSELFKIYFYKWSPTDLTLICSGNEMTLKTSPQLERFLKMIEKSKKFNYPLASGEKFAKSKGVKQAFNFLISCGGLEICEN